LHRIYDRYISLYIGMERFWMIRGLKQWWAFALAAMLMFAAGMSVAAAANGPLVLAASSLQESLTAAADSWAAQGHARPVLSFAASSALARQVEAGAPADLFISADEQWMEYLDTKGLLAPRTRVSVLANRLVLIAPAARPVSLAIRPGFPAGPRAG
jgi:molybdate transport system substrate-binding protein